MFGIYVSLWGYCIYKLFIYIWWMDVGVVDGPWALCYLTWLALTHAVKVLVWFFFLFQNFRCFQGLISLSFPMIFSLLNGLHLSCFQPICSVCCIFCLANTIPDCGDMPCCVNDCIFRRNILAKEDAWGFQLLKICYALQVVYPPHVFWFLSPVGIRCCKQTKNLFPQSQLLVCIHAFLHLLIKSLI